MNSDEKKLFLSLCFPMIPKGIGEGLRGELLYELKSNNIKEKHLAEAFPQQYLEIKKLLQKKPLFGWFDKNNYIFDYFFSQYNPNSKKKVIPAHLVGFKAERIGEKTKLKASVKLPSGKIVNADLDISPVIKMEEINFNAHILVHYDTICLILKEPEYKEIIQKYFSRQETKEDNPSFA